MKKIISLFSFYLCTITLIAQNFDVRKVNWGMTIQEVVNSEYPMHSTIDGDEVRFKDVDIGNTFTATLIYSFTNGILKELKYIVYGSQYSRGTCDNIIPLTDKVRFSAFIFSTLEKKGYKCDILLGWFLDLCLFAEYDILSLEPQYEDTEKSPFLFRHCNTDYETVSIVEKTARKRGATRVVIQFENDRSNAKFSFNEHQNCKSAIEISDDLKMPCNSDYYNTWFWLTFKPNYKVKKEMDSSRF